MDKREGGGSYNWGTMSDDIKAEHDTANTSAETGNEASTNAGGDKEHDDSRTKDEPKEEEPKTLTLEEWKAQQDKKTEHKFNLRKAGEGSDLDPKWKKAYAYKKEKETQEEDEDEVRWNFGGLKNVNLNQFASRMGNTTSPERTRTKRYWTSS